jgi:hypothetical protein
MMTAVTSPLRGAGVPGLALPGRGSDGSSLTGLAAADIIVPSQATSDPGGRRAGRVVSAVAKPASATKGSANPFKWAAW